MAQRKTLHRKNVTVASRDPKHRHDDSSQVKDDTLDPSVFYTCPWLSNQTPYLLYRVLMAGGVLYFIWLDVQRLSVNYPNQLRPKMLPESLVRTETPSTAHPGNRPNFPGTSELTGPSRY
ncbi:Hypp4147 [Branchiostoma lanceolatum]|uniref:Hypp4147 protein n=1 Tax=Branchiostoma lanceolatum TaxID=7740 RepID=A0A8K0F0D1_BRALA|nr:Hypp4147 [Branchiostoma lanceolatum]